MFRGGGTGDTHTYTHAATTVITKRLSVCAWPSLFPTVCVRISPTVPPVTSTAMCSCSVSQFLQLSYRYHYVVMPYSPPFESPGCRSGGTSRCSARPPPYNVVLSRPVCSPRHRGRTATTTQTIGYTDGPPESRGLPLVSNHGLLTPDWSVFKS